MGSRTQKSLRLHLLNRSSRQQQCDHRRRRQYLQELADLPYGNIRDNVGSVDVNHKYTGQEHDESTGLYFYNARYYDPVLGRFTQADSIVPGSGNPQNFNRYSYVGNNPINMIDPSGHEALIGQNVLSDEEITRRDNSNRGGGSVGVAPQNSIEQNEDKNNDCPDCAFIPAPSSDASGGTAYNGPQGGLPCEPFPACTVKPVFASTPRPPNPGMMGMGGGFSDAGGFLFGAQPVSLASNDFTAGPRISVDVGSSSPIVSGAGATFASHITGRSDFPLTGEVSCNGGLCESVGISLNHPGFRNRRGTAFIIKRDGPRPFQNELTVRVDEWHAGRNGFDHGASLLDIRSNGGLGSKEINIYDRGIFEVTGGVLGNRYFEATICPPCTRYRFNDGNQNL